MKRFLLISVFLLVWSTVSSLFAQSVYLTATLTDDTNSKIADANNFKVANAARGYYIKDGAVHHVWISTESSELQARRLFIPFQPGHLETVFTPEEVSEYGLTEGTGKLAGRFVSVEIDGGWIFMEELQRVDDDTSILFLTGTIHEDTYYLLDGGVVSKIATTEQPGPLWEYLSSLNYCTMSWSGSVKYPARLKSGMVKRYYNAFAYCNEKMFPKPRFGVTVSVGVGRPNVYDERIGDVVSIGGEAGSEIITFSQSRYRFDPTFSVGAFYRLPLEEVVSFQPELHYSFQVSTGSEGNKEINGMAASRVAFRNHSVRVPLMFRFTNNYAKGNLMPYAELGPVVAFNFGKYWDMKYSDRKRSLPPFTPGLAVGVGMEYYMDAVRAVNVGARLNWVAKMGGSRDRTYSLLSIELVTSFSIFNF